MTRSFRPRLSDWIVVVISANVGLLLFTGKNVYFLAASSLSDAAEASLLVLLALWALDGKRVGGSS